ncbi:DUF1826 domain-containing protein [Candidatus Nitrospira inopinata]|uniref:DUF1826 domain-containing protein n=1 Tax=Candidatus Nitrospira inopinata TaxID=1715989 RepID=A0A0S4KS68_9BACT|nr:DUF1826 domain-containing protein [Candidatus Nitrospira inopinata]CUQ67313.1 protein of unknown function [Candidatus Nitrospira inopinata]
MKAHRHHPATEDDPTGRSVSTIRIDGMAVDSSPLPRNMVIITDWSNIDRLADPTKNLLLYPWLPSASLQQAIVTRPFAELPQMALPLPKDKLAGAATMVEDDLARRLLEECAPALAAFASIAPAGNLYLSLRKTREQSCPLFHVDRYPLRLLCTLRGPGTEWLDDEQVNRKGLGQGDNRKVAPPHATVYAAQPFQILVLKGDGGCGTSRGVVHRSPIVPASSDGRWYLRIDPLPTTRPMVREWSRL